jgi:phosphotransacetylase
MFDSGRGDDFQNVIDLVDMAGRVKASTVAVVGGDRVEDLTLVESARDHGIVDRIILIGRPGLIRQALNSTGIAVADSDIIEGDDDEQIASAAAELVKARSIDVLLKGNISTPVINRALLPLAISPTVSLVTIFDAAPIRNSRPVILTDAGVTTVCNFERMAHIIRNAVEVAHVVMSLNRPKVAVLSANEKQIKSLPSTELGLRLAQMEWDDAVVCGPLSFDLATDPGSVAVKGMPDLPNAHEVAGQADILVCPGLDSANMLYKFISALNKYGQASLASITMGFDVPYIILSRSDTVETKLVSVALCSLYAQRKMGARGKGAKAAG